jgi:hypothetical protein
MVENTAMLLGSIAVQFKVNYGKRFSTRKSHFDEQQREDDAR